MKLGIDSLMTNGIHRGDMQYVRPLLGLPETHCFPLIAVVLGYPTEAPTGLKGRLDGVGVIHRERYHSPTAAEVEDLTRQYDDRARHLALNDDWAGQGHKHYLDWLFKDWMRGSAKPTDKETQMLQLLRKCGFVESQKA